MKPAISLFILASVLLLGIAMKTQSESLPERKMISYKSDGETVSGFLVTPEGKGPFPAILLIHEWWGLNDSDKE
jgi:carboxymethylenebutenolidase